MRIIGILKGAALALGLSVLPSSAATVTVTVDGRLWDVSIADFSAGADTDRNRLEAQYWWGSEALAREFATAVGDRLGPCLVAATGPCFAYNPSAAVSGNILVARLGALGVFTFNVNPFTTGFAVAQEVTALPPVPLPAGGLLLLTGLAAAAVAGRRRKKAVA